MKKADKYFGKLPKEETSKDGLFALLFLVMGASLLIGCMSGVDAKEYNDVKITQKAVTEQSEDDNRYSNVEAEIREIAGEENFQWTDYLVRLADCESTLNPTARNDNGYYGVDRGVFQINDYFHPEVSTECADNVECATKWTIDMINSGQQHQWSCNKIVLNN